MQVIEDHPETLMEAIQYFSTGDNAFNFLVAMRWPDAKVCCLVANPKKSAF